MTTKNLEEKLSRLGFPLMEAAVSEDVNQTLAEVVKSQDTRYFEGFPVMLANAAKDAAFDYGQVELSLSSAEHKKQLKELFLLSLGLYEALTLKFSWVSQWRGQASKSDVLTAKDFGKKLADDKPLEAAGRQFFPQRLKDTFAHYYREEAARLKALDETQGALSLEFGLSQVFSPKQKELFKKKLSGERLTKTEREYFSRAVKKKVAALANDELHSLARKVLG